MHPFNATYQAVPDERISDLLAATNAAGFPTPILTPLSGDPASVSATPSQGSALRAEAGADLPTSWRVVQELEGQSYTWPQYREQYTEYRVYAGETEREGTVHIALGKARRTQTWERDREYIIAFLTSGSPQTPLAEFLETDDFEETDDYIAVIRGRGGPHSKKMYGPGDPLPPAYATLRTVLYRDYIDVAGAYSKMAVLANEDEPEEMLNHALIQARRRGDL